MKKIFVPCSRPVTSLCVIYLDAFREMCPISVIPSLGSPIVETQNSQWMQTLGISEIKRTYTNSHILLLPRVVGVVGSVP